MLTKLPIRVLASEAPLDAVALGVAPVLPRRDLAPCGCLVHQPSAQTLTVQDADLDLRHVQPTRVLGRVMEHHPSQE